MNFDDALEYLNRVRELGTKLSLDNIQRLVNNLPFSLKKIKFIQVAGTNGKGSTSHFITSILMQNGYKVGLFTSPHLEDIKERVSINKEWISEEEFTKSIFNVKKISEELLKKNKIDNIPTFFEHILLLSLDYFYRKNVDFAVLEVGLGGRLDATSTIIPELHVITNISYDHTKTLGKRIKDIALEKAGVIKRKIPVVCGCPPKTRSRKVIREVSDKKGSKIYFVVDKNNKIKYKFVNDYYEVEYITQNDRYKYNLRMNGKHQIINSATAIKVSEVLRDKGVRLKKNLIESGIENNMVRGRIEYFRKNPLIIIDTGHNVSGIKVLRDFLEERNHKNLTLIFGVLRDKKYRQMIRLLDPFVKEYILTTPISKRAINSNQLKNKIKDLIGKKRVSCIEDYNKIVKLAKNYQSDILISGSFYMAGEIRKLLSGGK